MALGYILGPFTLAGRVEELPPISNDALCARQPR